MQPTYQHPLHILLADDDKDDRFFFKKALEDFDIKHVLQTVPNGEQLMDYLTGNIKHLPDILFLDINMPRKNGLECLVEIKSNNALKKMPVIIYTTSLLNEVVDELYKLGAHYYLHKCGFAELPTRIESVLNLLAQNPGQPSRDEFVLNLLEL
jgi:CheY-like chemotaxis protein